MNKGSNSDDWLQAELADTLDEDIELELSEPALSEEIRKIYKTSHPPTIERAEYFQHLLTLQAELIKLQDWYSTPKRRLSWSLKAAMPRAKAAQSSASRSG